MTTLDWKQADMVELHDADVVLGGETIRTVLWAGVSMVRHPSTG